ncbi:hypothetical protein ACL7TT_11620 [Microbulbifer sp. 2304DJ12-6]|uniref:hypothetical protein n=1 Tax=Microbulbifer sp. 2304DJ12-6 TaxID=3233340 RepID=UPI0039B00AC9
MATSFKLVLLTSMVTTTCSLAAGDEIEVGNDEAWRLLNDGLARPKSKKQKSPTKPQRVAEEEAKALEAQKRQAKMQLPCVHPEGKELNEALTKIAERDQKIQTQGDIITELEGKLALLEEENCQLQEQLAQLTEHPTELPSCESEGSAGVGNSNDGESSQ